MAQPVSSFSVAHEVTWQVKVQGFVANAPTPGLGTAFYTQTTQTLYAEVQTRFFQTAARPASSGRTQYQALVLEQICLICSPFCFRRLKGDCQYDYFEDASNSNGTYANAELNSSGCSHARQHRWCCWRAGTRGVCQSLGGLCSTSYVVTAPKMFYELCC